MALYIFVKPSQKPLHGVTTTPPTQGPTKWEQKKYWASLIHLSGGKRTASRLKVHIIRSIRSWMSSCIHVTVHGTRSLQSAIVML